MARKLIIPKTVTSRDGKETGTTTGTTRVCGLNGCTGIRIGVKWPGGKMTWPCTKSLTYSKNAETAKLR